jgi:hypothetical protein
MGNCKTDPIEEFLAFIAENLRGIPGATRNKSPAPAVSGYREKCGHSRDDVGQNLTCHAEACFWGGGIFQYLPIQEQF